MAGVWETRIPPWLYARLFVSWRRVRREVEVLRRVFERFGVRRVVEFGCGVGRHGYMLSKLGFNVLLTDVSDWRFGVARRLPFALYDVLKGGILGEFDGGYAMGLLIVLSLADIPRALENMASNVRRGGVLVFDYNFTTYNEPREVTVKVRGRVYKALLKWDSVEPIEGGVFYRYRIEVVDDRGGIVGVEDTGYPVYSKEAILNAIRKTGLEVADIIWARWDPVKYMYRPSKRESDSAFIVLRKP